ncbi:MAG: pseudouridine synthase [Myxococcales bacterium]|jgi:23S rRNA pseudouridine2605 synthase
MPRLSKWVRAVRGGGLDGKPITCKPDWIGRALPRAGILPPDEAEAAILAGRVSFAGRIVVDPLALLAPGDEVLLDGRRVDLAAPTFVLAFHKPAGCVVSRRDDRDRKTAFDLLHAALPTELRRYGWHAVGRLDLDTTGMLLFSNDERVVRHVTLPETHLSKRYLATVSGAPTDERLEPLRQGILLHDGPARPALARVRGPNEVELTITEGRRHQVKRMLKAVGLPVRALHREAIGGLELDLPEGAWRMLSASELRDGLRLDLAPHA